MTLLNLLAIKQRQLSGIKLPKRKLTNSLTVPLIINLFMLMKKKRKLRRLALRLRTVSCRYQCCRILLNTGFDKVRFLQPVTVNSRVRAHAKTLAIEEKKPGQYRLSTEVTIEIEGCDTPALVAEWISVQMVK